MAVSKRLRYEVQEALDEDDGHAEMLRLIADVGIDGWFGKAIYRTLSRQVTDARMLAEMGVA